MLLVLHTLHSIICFGKEYAARMNMRIMSFNVRGAYWQQDGINYWPQRAALNVATIARYQPDVIGFQELQAGNYEIYQQQLPHYAWSLGPYYGNDAPYEYPAIAWNPARCRLVAAGGFWLSETPLVHSESWATACIRSAQWLRFQPNAGGASWIVLNTHLDHISAEARLQGARLIVEQLAAMDGEPIIITGDFNCDPHTAPYEIFCDAGYADSYLVAGSAEQPDNTYHGFDGLQYQVKDGRSERIDWILARHLSIQHAEIVRDGEPPIYPSDHYPIIADLAFAAQ
jgi:endonuclease/exonuclease/phosphatase family metal-dependent hydrolase